MTAHGAHPGARSAVAPGARRAGRRTGARGARHSAEAPAARLGSPEFAARFLAEIAEALGHGGLALTLLPNAGAAEVLPVRDVAMDGAIIYSCSTTESSFGWLRKRRLPLVLAADVLRAAAELGLRVPTELSVVGFDDSSLAQRLAPPLTTVAQDVVAKGTLAAEELIKAVRRRRAGEPDRVRRHLLPTELVVRGTTAPPGPA